MWRQRALLPTPGAGAEGPELTLPRQRYYSARRNTEPAEACKCQEVPAAGAAPLLALNDGRLMPGVGLGTWLGHAINSRDEKEDRAVERAIKWALEAGYRHIDTAFIYDTEEQVGHAINTKIRDGLKRENIFVSTKLWNDKHARDAVVPALRQSLKNLGLTYVDLYLIHWPIGLNLDGTYDNTDYLDTWQGMIEARDRGLTRSIGVSNFNQQMLDRIISLSPAKPSVLQVEINLNVQQPRLLAFCRAHSIHVTGYTPFGSLFHKQSTAHRPPPRADDPVLAALAGKYNKTVPQVVLRYLVDLGVVPIPKSITKHQIVQNLDIFDFQLSPQECDLLRKYDRNYRVISVTAWMDSPYYPFEKD